MNLIPLPPRDFRPTAFAKRSTPALIKLLDLSHGMEREAVIAELGRRVSAATLENLLS